MNEEFWVRVQETYLAAVELPSDQQRSFLNRIRLEAPEIRQEVESLLEHQAAAKRIDRSAVALIAAEMFSEEESSLVGTVLVGKYLIRECLARGGMAEVYLADHIALDMPFAPKRPKREFGGDQRFYKFTAWVMDDEEGKEVDPDGICDR
jgi:hypothetical protein